MANTQISVLSRDRGRFRGLAWRVLAGLCAVLLSASACDPRFDSGCPSGTINCPCLPEGTCDEGEGECIDDLCVDTDIDEPIPPQEVQAGPESPPQADFAAPTTSPDDAESGLGQREKSAR